MKRNYNFDPITGENLSDEWEFQKPGICNAIIGGLAAVGTAAYSANQQKKAQKAAAAAQQKGIDDAQAYNKEAAEAASKMLDPLARLREPSQADLVQNMQQNRFLGNLGTAQLLQQTSPLNVNEFFNPYLQDQLNAGQKAVETSAAARGGLMSGATLRALQQNAQQIAGANWQNAAQLAMNNRTQQTNLANTLMGQGDLATNINQRLFDTGVNTVGQQASIIAGQGANNANLAMTAGNVAAQARANQPSVGSSVLQAGLGAMGANGGAGWNALGGWLGGLSDEDKKMMDAPVSDEEIDDFLSAIEPSEFQYKPEAVKKYGAQGATPGRKVGVMAQDVEKSKMGKTIVKEDEEGTKMLDIPMSVGALLATTSSLNKRLKAVEKKKGAK